MATTTGGTTYVTGTDLVASYPTASLALANRVDVVASGGPVLVKTGAYTITVADILSGNKFLYNSASGGTFTFPTASLVDGMVIQVSQIGAGALTVSGGTIVGTTVTTAQYQSLSFVYVASGTTWYSVLPPSTAPGLAIVTPTSIANSGGSASASGGLVTFTAVSSVSLNGIFSSTYANYRTIFTIQPSAAPTMTVRMRTAGTDNSAASYEGRTLFYYGATSGVESTAAGTSFDLRVVTTGYNNGFNLDINDPFNTTPTNIIGQCSVYVSGATYVGRQLAYTHASSTSFDGMTLYPSTGTITGTIRVYGYKNS